MWHAFTNMKCEIFCGFTELLNLTTDNINICKDHTLEKMSGQTLMGGWRSVYFLLKQRLQGDATCCFSLLLWEKRNFVKDELACGLQV